MSQLPQFGRRQLIRKFRLSRQDDLQQLGLRGLEIGEEPHCLENGRVQILRFVDDDDDTTPRPVFLQHIRIKLIDDGREVRVLIDFPSKFIEKQAHELARSALGMKEEDDTRGRAKMPHQLEQQGGFSHTGRRNERQEPSPEFHAAQQCGEGFAVR